MLPVSTWSCPTPHYLEADRLVANLSHRIGTLLLRVKRDVTHSEQVDTAAGSR